MSKDNSDPLTYNLPNTKVSFARPSICALAICLDELIYLNACLTFYLFSPLFWEAISDASIIKKFTCKLQLISGRLIYTLDKKAIVEEMLH